MHRVMRNVSFAFASLASLVAATAVAHADPLAVAATASPDAVPSSYVQGGVMAGANDGLLTDGASAEVGKRVQPYVWVHASMTMGSADELFASGTGSILQARAGADLMGCNANGVLCAFAGADVGFQHTEFSGMSVPLFCDGEDCQGDAVYDHHAGMIGVGRVGLDIGGKHLRWRPGVEGSVSGTGVGVNVTQSVAYRF
jgi:hypothetical protein